jgi:hypothetical protein
MADKLKKGEGDQAAWSDAVLHKLLSELKHKYYNYPLRVAPFSPL